MSIKYNQSQVGVRSADPTKVGAYDAWNHVSSNEIYEPQRTNHFEFIVTSSSFSNLRLPVGSKDAAEITSNMPETLRLAVKSFFVPHYTQDVITVNRGNNELHYAGGAHFTAGDLVVHDFIGSDAKEILMAWQSMSYNIKTEKVGLTQDYKKTCKLVEYTPDYRPVRTWILEGCWIDSISENNYDYENTNSTQQITAHITYDRGYIGSEYSDTIN